MSKDEERRQKEIEAKARSQFMQTGFSQRLQSENPFDEFRMAVEDAVIKKTMEKGTIYEGDQDFYKESDDIGMCLSMH